MSKDLQWLDQPHLRATILCDIFYDNTYNSIAVAALLLLCHLCIAISVGYLCTQHLTANTNTSSSSSFSLFQYIDVYTTHSESVFWTINNFDCQKWNNLQESSWSGGRRQWGSNGVNRGKGGGTQRMEKGQIMEEKNSKKCKTFSVVTLSVCRNSWVVAITDLHQLPQIPDQSSASPQLPLLIL